MDRHATDYGEFTIRSSLNDDLKVLRASIAEAKRNPTKPGHHWLRYVVKQKSGTQEIETIKLFHVDLNATVAEITETTDGKETARRTLSLDELG